MLRYLCLFVHWCICVTIRATYPLIWTIIDFFQVNESPRAIMILSIAQWVCQSRFRKSCSSHESSSCVKPILPRGSVALSPRFFFSPPFFFRVKKWKVIDTLELYVRKFTNENNWWRLCAALLLFVTSCGVIYSLSPAGIVEDRTGGCCITRI